MSGGKKNNCSDTHPNIQLASENDDSESQG